MIKREVNIGNLVANRTKKTYACDPWPKHPRKSIKKESSRRLRRVNKQIADKPYNE